jgi:hypothetical protein
LEKELSHGKQSPNLPGGSLQIFPGLNQGGFNFFRLIPDSH